MILIESLARLEKDNTIIIVTTIYVKNKLFFRDSLNFSALNIP